MSETSWLRVSIDTFVHQGFPTSNWDHLTWLAVSVAAANERRILLRPSRPIDATKAANKVLDTPLRLTQKEAWTDAHTLSIKLLSAAFTENKVTWNTKPATRSEGAAAMTAALTGVAEGTVFEIDMATIMEAAANNGWTFYGVEITSNSTAVAKFFSELDSGGRGPRIKWEWAVEPKRPTQLHPAGARSATKPRFLARTQLTAVETQQIQVATDAAFSNVIRDNTLSGLSQYRVSYSPGAEFAALTSNATYFWRCRYTTPSGVTSAWSAGQQFSIKTKPTVAITAITAVETNDTTPTLSHSYVAGEGGAQSKYRYEVRQYDHATGKYLSPYFNAKTRKWHNGWLSGTLTGTATSVTPPAGALHTGRRYLQRTFVWDSATRDDDQTDRAYVLRTSIWRLLTDGATVPVTTLTVTQTTKDGQAAGISGDPPIVKVAWTGSADRFRVLRRLSRRAKFRILSDSAAADFAAEFGSGYEYYDIAASGRENIYKVLPIVGIKPAQSTSYNPFFMLESDKWTLTLAGGAASVLRVIDDVDTEANKALMVVITNGGAAQSDVLLRQALPAGTLGKVYPVKLRIRNRESGTKSVKATLRRSDTPFTEYDSETFNVGSTWVSKSWSWTLGAAVAPEIALALGNDTKDVDIDYFYAEIAPVGRITPSSFGWWLIAEDDHTLRVPLVINATGDEQIDESRTELHPLGGKFVVIRAAGAALRFSITAQIDEDEGRYLQRLEFIRSRALNCRLVELRGRAWSVQLTSESHKLLNIPSRKIYQVTLDLLEVDEGE